MTTVKIKRVYEPEEKGDGYRVLVDKLWPRGVRKAGLHYDIWAKNIAPSTPLRRWYHEDPEARWDEFRRKYMQELKGSDAMQAFLAQIKGKEVVTLLYGSKNAAENHALILKEYIEKALG